MKDFSEESKISSKDHLISKMVLKSGLPEKDVLRLYENFSMATDGNLVAINESFDNFLEPKTFDFENFKKIIIGFANQIAIPTFDGNQRSKISEDLVKFIEGEVRKELDKVTLMEIVCFVLMLKDDKKFSSIQKQIKFGENLSGLFEDARIDFTPINVSASNNQTINLQNAKETVHLYGSLRDMLARNEKHWGYNYHLDNAYQAIVDYLDKEIIELVNMDNMVSISNNYHNDIIVEFLRGRDINPLYRNADTIKKLVPDIQTLVFDMMLLIHDYISLNRDSIMFVSRPALIDYENTVKNLYSAISSSLKDSQVSLANNEKYQKEKIEPSSKIFHNFEVDYEKIDSWKYPVTMNSALNMLHLVKACTGEFNLKIRSIINTYVTKTLEVLIKSEKHIILKNSKYLM